MKIVFNTRRRAQYSTRRLFFDGLARDMAALGAQVALDDWDHYERYDVAIFMSSDLAGAGARRANPRLAIGIVHASDNSPQLLHETRQADFILAGSIEERDYYLRHNPTIFLVHHIEEDWLAWKQHEDRQAVVLGYHGNRYHLEQCYPHVGRALEALAKELPIQLRAIYDIRGLGPWRVGRPNVPIVDVQWQLGTLAQELLATDIGIMPSCAPITDSTRRRVIRTLLGTASRHFGAYENDWLVRYKNCTNAGRAFVFMQLGIPVVADMTPEACQVLQYGRTGFVALSAEGWYDALRRLAHSAALRTRIAEEAKRLFDGYFNRREIARRLLDELQALVAGKLSGVAVPHIRLPPPDERVYWRQACRGAFRLSFLERAREAIAHWRKDRQQDA